MQIRTWKDLRAIYTPLGLCKVVMEEYLEIGSIKDVAKKYKVASSTVRSYLDRHYNEFDEEAKELSAKMEAEMLQKRGRSRKDEVAEEIDEAKSLTKNQFIQLKCLDSIPKIVSYSEFLNIISKCEVQAFSTNDWLKLAASRGIKVVG